MKESILKWSRAQSGVLNLKAGWGITLFVVAYHSGDGYYVHPKLPGLKSIKVGSETEGQTTAIKQCLRWFAEVTKKNDSCRNN